MINNQEIEYVDMFSIKDGGAIKFQSATYEIDRTARVIKTKRYSYPGGKEKTISIAKFNDDWLVKSAEMTSAEGELILRDSFEYEEGLLIRKKELRTNWYSVNKEDEIVINKKDFFYRYDTGHNETVGIVCYNDWEKQDFSHNEKIRI